MRYWDRCPAAPIGISFLPFLTLFYAVEQHGIKFVCLYQRRGDEWVYFINLFIFIHWSEVRCGFKVSVAAMKPADSECEAIQ